MGDGPVVVARRRLVARLDEAVTHRLTVVVADAGFGKTELLEQWLVGRADRSLLVARPQHRDVAGIAACLVESIDKVAPDVASRLSLVARPTPDGQHRIDSLAGSLSSALSALPSLQVVLALDDAHLMSEPALRFVEALLRHGPPNLRLLVLSRQELPIAVHRLDGPVQQIAGHELGFDDAELEELMLLVAGDPEHAPAVRALLGRWPAAVRLAAEQVARVPADRRTSELVRLKRYGASDLVALAHEVVLGESARTRRLAQVLGPYDGFTAELAEELGCDDAAVTIALLESRGIVVRLGEVGQQYFAFPRLLREFVRSELPMTPQERPGLVRRAGDWFERHDQPEGALRCAVDQRDAGWVARLLREHGHELVAAGRAGRVAQAFALLEDGDRDARLDEVEGALREHLGDTVAALRCYVRAAERSAPVSAWVAYRTGYLHYFRGDLELALTAFGSADPGPDSADLALLQAWQATCLWALGEVSHGWQVAEAALALAERLGDPRALAAAHTITAMLCAHGGDRTGSREHYDVALLNAERAGDVLQVVRVRNNRGSGLLEEGELDAALPELEAAIELAQAGGLPFYLSLALTNRGDLRFHKGQYDAALADLEKARELDLVAGTQSSSVRIFLGHVYRHRGYDNAARLAYEEVLAIGRSTGDRTLVVPALCGLAQLLCETDPLLAGQLSDEALSYDSGIGRVNVLTTAGWVAHAQGRWEDAQRWAELARAEAVARRDRLGEAEALQLLVVTDQDPVADDPRLDRAAAIVDEIGAPVWRARVRLEQARRRPPEEALAIIEQVQQLAAALGARNLADKAAAVARSLDRDHRLPQVEVVTLGGFRVRRDGATLGMSDWPDESASGLLKRLTSVASRSWSRPALQRSLWSGTPAEQAEPLLEAAIAHLREALDPQSRFGAGQFVVEHGDAVYLESIEVDVHAFFEESEEGLSRADGRDLLRRAEARYSGDYLEEHPTEPWALTLREDARARYIEVARALTQLSARAGDADAAARYSRRILARDPYDEGAHVALVGALNASGRTAEARSCYATYVARLEDLGLEAIPWELVNDAAAAA